MVIFAIPFATAVLGDYPREPLAITLYCGNLIFAGMALFILWRYAAGPGRLLDPDIDPALIRAAERRILMGPVIYLAAIGLAYVNATIGLILCIATPWLYLFPGRIDRFWRRGQL